MRGTLTYIPESDPLCGLSPHTRGTHWPAAVRTRNIRFIPSYAGNTPRPSRWFPSAPVYPRIRGEHTGPRDPLASGDGLSPHTRGTLVDCESNKPLLRFIPAYAGNTFFHSYFILNLSVYPRIRGEHSQTERYCHFCFGLSPHTRGTHVYLILFLVSFRFIPAYAGNTSILIRHHCQLPVYPRIRGEHNVFTEQFEIFDGLSPHTRGTHESLAVTAFARRFIPAYAGNTWKRVFDRKQVPVYPRIRGEHGDMLANSAPPTGLSPHTRGTPSLCGTGSRNVRFIPAYAGNTLGLIPGSVQFTVYPRIRGEHS